MNTNDTKARVSYAAALTRFLTSTGTTAAELSELSGVPQATIGEAVLGRELPSAADRGRLADTITRVQRERAL